IWSIGYNRKWLNESKCVRSPLVYKKVIIDYDGGFVSFGDGKGRIFGKGKIKTRTLDFDDVYFSSNFKLLDESQVLLRVPRKDNIYSVDLKSVVPIGGLTCLFAKAIIDESNLCVGFKGPQGVTVVQAGATTTMTLKLPILNPREYDLQLLRIEQYFLMTDYSFWKVIKNGDKVLTKLVWSSKQTYQPTTAEEKQDRRNEIKARGTMLMALPNKDQLKFHSYQDAKLLMEAFEKRYGRNKESKKVQRILLKQQYENFAASSSKTLNQTFDRLQKLISQLELQREPNSPQLAREDLKQINLNDLKEIDLHLEIAMLTIRARRFIKRTCRNLDINGQKIGFDRSKVKCFNCHKNRHFARECRALKNQENRGREYGRKIVPLENPTENALIAQDGIGRYDWSYQAKEVHPTNYALMILTSSGSSSSSDSKIDSCSKTCLKAYATLKEQYDSLSSDYKKSQFNLVSYKTGLQSVEERLVHYKKNEAVFEEKINISNLKVRLRDNALVEYTKKLEKAEKERDELKLTLEKYQNSSKSLGTLLESQKNVKSKSDKGYHAVPLPYTKNYIPPKHDLMFIDEQVESESVDVVSNVPSSAVKTVESKVESVDINNKDVYNTVETTNVKKNNFSPLIIEDWISNDESEVEFEPKVEDKTVRPSIEKIKFVKSASEKAEKVETPKQHKHYPRWNQRNWNNLTPKILGSKLKTAGTPVNTVRPVNTADSKTIMNYLRPISNAFKRGYSQAIRPSNKYSAYKKTIFNKEVNAVKASACWGNLQQKEYQEKGVIDSDCSRHMTGNKCYLIDYEDYDGGFVSFGDGA
nr:hypothetical protein [Tanacetum cinerariifolium]